MKKLFLLLLFPLLMGAGCNFMMVPDKQPTLDNKNMNTNTEQEQAVGGQQDDYGCLIAAGYSYDDFVKACVRSWELNDEKKQIAKLAVEYLIADQDYFGLTVIDVIPARCPGCWHVRLTDAEDRQFELSVTNGVVKDVSYDYFGDLTDVSGGEASGTARAYFDGETYHLIAEFEDLPEPGPDYFYEGWVVRSEPFNFISTGVTDLHKNVFEAEEDLTDYNLYVLTLEPDDGDPAPAEHILEGTMIK